MPRRRHTSGRSSRSFSITLPATSANIGPAFDAAALAIGLYIKVQARPAPDFSVAAYGRDQEICGRVHDHLIIDTYRDVMKAEGKAILPIAIRIENEMPIGKGCGSSAAARLTGIALAVHFGSLDWVDARIVGEASRREHHPDNAAACWMGGLSIGRVISDTEAQVVKLTPKGKWPLLFAVPDEPLSTEEARRVLPASYSRQDIVANIQSSMLMLAAFVQGRHEIMSAVSEDRIHQPYRAHLCPLLPAIQQLTGTTGILAAVLSGAGPSVLIFLDPKSLMERVKSRVRASLKKRRLSAELIATHIDDQGARERIATR